MALNASAARPLRRSAAFVAGISVAVLPAIAPFLALLAVVAGRIRLQRTDRWWWSAALLLALPFALTDSLVTAGLAAIQVLAVWLLFRAACEIRQATRNLNVDMPLGAGLVVGLAATLVMGIARIDGFSWKMSITALDAIVWKANPGIFGHSMFVLSALLAVVVPSARLRTIAIALGAAGVLLSGAREAVYAWLLFSGLLFAGSRSRSTVGRVVEWVLFALVLATVGGLGPVVGLGRTGFLTSFVSGSSGPNIFRGTEIGDADWWHSLGVRYETRAVDVEGQARTGFVVTKVSPEPWSRLQQVVTLEPSTTYTLGTAWKAEADSRPGLDGWGQVGADEAPAILSATRVGAALDARTTGPIEVIAATIEDLPEGWQRANVTFVYEGTRPLIWYTGVVVDRSPGAGDTLSFAELQLTRSDTAIPYVPGHAERGVTDLRASRFPIWQDALQAIGARPWLGWGSGGLPEAVTALDATAQRVRPIPSHAHDMVLDVLVQRGLVGGTGLLLLFTLLALRSIQQRDREMLAVLAGVVVLNLFDATLFSGEVIYALALVLGWRAVGEREIATAETGMGSATAVRLTLAAADALAGGVAMALAIVVAGRWYETAALTTSWTLPLSYASILWPLMAAWSGLHPGYGRPGYDELARTVRAALAATLLLALAALVLPDTFRLPAIAILVTGLVSVLLAPVFRATAKSALRAMRLWGRPVVLLGTGPEAQRTTRHLLRHPGIGLHPIAVFGDGGGWTLDDLPVTGALEHAWAFLEQENVRHVIVTPDAAARLAFDDLLIRADRRLRYVQYLPDLGGLPTNSVAATPLGTALGLEVRNQLASGTNRAVKRVIDVLGATVLLAVLGVPLALIALAIRLDSRGSPFYLSPRVGRYGRSFSCVKFRTMHVDADERLQRLLAADPDLREEYEHYHKLENDPRVTRIGRLLRRGSIDELPQLWNVLVGDMSLVGPRPYLVRELDDMSRLKDLIFLARPGMTGYWQVEARNDVGFDERQVMEAHYVRNWSVWWDIEILVRTPAAILDRTGK